MAPTVGVKWSDLVARVQALGPSQPEAIARLNQAHRYAVAESGCLREKVTVGTTTAGTNVYDLPAGVVRLLSLRVNDAGGYERYDVDDIDDLNSGDAFTIGFPARFFASEFGTDGTARILISPTPTVSGQAITGRAELYPDDFTLPTNANDYPKLPPHFHEALVDPGSLAVTLSRDDERFAEAGQKQAEFDDVIRRIRGFKNRRIGSGVARVRLAR